MQNDELAETRALCEANLASVEEALAAAPADAELLQMRQELQEALDGIRAAQAEVEDAVPPSAAAETAPAEVPAAPRPQQRPRVATGGNARIHPRSLYATSEPDFAALADSHPGLRPYLKGLPSSTTDAAALSSAAPRRATIDFSNPAACRELTKALLSTDFGVDWNLPDGHLVPPVTNRLNYLLWIQDLLELSSPPNNTDIKGLDIGCGASLIYPLLGAAAMGWSFVGVDVTTKAVAAARQNLHLNPHLEGLIEVRRVKMQPGQAELLCDEGGNAAAAEKGEGEESGGGGEREGSGILTGAVRRGERFAFSMCNPPFFERMSQAGANPATAYGGTAAESVYPGGEEAFVGAMLEDSLILKDRIHWYTTMVGKKATLKSIKARLHAARAVTAVRTTEFAQGQTSRWGVAWSLAADPRAAAAPLRRGGGGESATAAPAKRRRVVVGRFASLQLAVRDAGAAVLVLESVAEGLKGAGMECSIDKGKFEVRAMPGDAGMRVAGVCPITVTLMAQQPKLFVLTVAADKGGPPPRPAAQAWLGGALVLVEEAAAAHGRVI